MAREESSRIVPIDATRGTAMLLVFLSHFADQYLLRNNATLSYTILRQISKAATPTFMIISGIMLGYLYHIHKNNYAPVQSKLRDRGLFMLIIGHPIISIAHIPLTGSFFIASTHLFITDTIAVCILLGPFLIKRWSPLCRAAIGLGIYFAGWIAAFVHYPDTLVWSIARSIFCGSEMWIMNNYLRYTFPIIPWFGIYFACSCLGEKIAELRSDGKLEKCAPLIGRLALLSLIVSLFAMAAWRSGKVPWLFHFPYFPALQGSSFFKKLPPGPFFILFYGAIGLLILYGLFKMPNTRLWRMYAAIASLLGRTSLFVFIVQYFVYYVFFHLAVFHYSVFWPTYLIGSIAAIISVAHRWDASGGNRLLTLCWSNQR
jgi:uncharacterized membrane protein